MENQRIAVYEFADGSTQEVSIPDVEAEQHERAAAQQEMQFTANSPDHLRIVDVRFEWK